MDVGGNQPRPRVAGAQPLTVVTPFAPRPDHPLWMDYLPLLRLLGASARRFGHRHRVVTDAELPGFETLRVALPAELMPAILAENVAYLETWDDSHPVVFADCDCLVMRDLGGAFDGSFDIGLTHRDNPADPINNGVIYLAAGARTAALAFFRRALAVCGTEWGADQWAVAAAAAPVPDEDGVQVRNGVRYAFLPMVTHQAIPSNPPHWQKGNPFVVHFKGRRDKALMTSYAARLGVTA